MQNYTDIHVKEIQNRLSTAALSHDPKVLAYALPLDKVSHTHILNDVRLILHAYLKKDSYRFHITMQSRYNRWGATSLKHNEVVCIKTAEYSHESGYRMTKKSRRVPFNDNSCLDIETLLQAAREVVQLDKDLEAANDARRRERERNRKIKEHAMKFIGATTSNSRTKVMIESFEYDMGKPDKSEVNLNLVGSPKKLKQAMNALAKLGVVRGRKS